MALPDVIERWVSVFQGSFDLEEYLRLFSEDVEFRDGETGRVIRGKSGLSEFVRPFTRLSGVSAKVLAHAVNEDKVFLEGELKATAPTGQEVISRGVGVFTIAGTHVSSFAMYMFRQNIDP